VQDTIVFNREGREVGIGNQIAQRVPAAKHLLKNCPVLIAGLNNTDTGLIEPALHPVSGFFERERTLVESCVGADSNESG
jgi:hypothetical protein